jgi:hypothetical protein
MKPNKALIHICQKLATLDVQESRQYLMKMGWTYLGCGSYKTAYAKKGIPFVIKICNGTNTWRDRREDEFLLGDTIKPLPSVYWGITVDGHYFGLQERCRYTFEGYRNELKRKLERRMEAKLKRKDPHAKIDYVGRNACYEHSSKRVWKCIDKWFEGNADKGTTNCGITYDGRPVQFD